MNLITLTVLLITVFVLGYLVIALLNPERF
jgi:K+-transporting ATPase KdpF subunit